MHTVMLCSNHHFLINTKHSLDWEALVWHPLCTIHSANKSFVTASGKVTTFPFGIGAKLNKIPSLPVTSNTAFIGAPRIPKPPEPALVKLLPTSPHAAKKPAEVVIIDDSDSEDDTPKIMVKPMATQREEIIIDELDNEGEAHANEGTQGGWSAISLCFSGWLQLNHDK